MEGEGGIGRGRKEDGGRGGRKREGGACTSKWKLLDDLGTRYQQEMQVLTIRLTHFALNK